MYIIHSQLIDSPHADINNMLFQAMIVQNLWQLIQGPFYIIIDISQTYKDYASISLQLIWIGFAFSRLLLLVQPAHSCLLEVH